MSRRTPQLSESKVREILEANYVDQRRVNVVAVRGYYLDSMGVPGKNDRRIYDDAMFVVYPDGILRFQANTDPNGYRAGHGTGKYKGMAMLKEGIHLFAKGHHKGKLAFRQAERFTVVRDGSPPYDDLGHHAINLHSGGFHSTSSLGCQTVPADNWDFFRRTVYDLQDTYKNPIRKNDRGQRVIPGTNIDVRVLPYVLIDEESRRDDNLIVSNRYVPR